LFVVVRVMTSTPAFAGVYRAVNAPTFVPDDGEIALESDDVNVHDVAFATDNERNVPDPCCTKPGPLIDAAAAGTIVNTATASSPAPQAVAARPE